MPRGDRRPSRSTPARRSPLELYLTNAKADLDNGESAFLSLTADGWRISAAGCKPGDGPPAEDADGLRARGLRCACCSSSTCW